MDLQDANLSDATLSDANLSDADLAFTDLTDKDLGKADRSNTEVDSTNLADATRRESTTYTTERRNLLSAIETFIGGTAVYLFAKNETKERHVELAQHWEKVLIYAGLAGFVSGSIVVFYNLTLSSVGSFYLTLVWLLRLLMH